VTEKNCKLGSNREKAQSSGTAGMKRQRSITLRTGSSSCGEGSHQDAYIRKKQKGENKLGVGTRRDLFQ